jgi:hypothetical protein
VEEDIELDDDLYPYACEGHLVGEGWRLAPSSELLAYAYEKQWVNWEHLWAEDWFDRLR